MTLRDTTERGQGERISFTADLAHPPEKVWRALTDPELLSKWLLPVTGLSLEEGTDFRFAAPPQPGWDGSVDCCFTTIEPGRRLAYRWVVGDLDTLVTFTLTPTDQGTHLTLVQSGFTPNQKHNVGGARYGWRMMGSRLVELLEESP